MCPRRESIYLSFLGGFRRPTDGALARTLEVHLELQPVGHFVSEASGRALQEASGRALTIEIISCAPLKTRGVGVRRTRFATQGPGPAAYLQLETGSRLRSGLAWDRLPRLELT
jgi:hypothetical protein